MNEMNQAGIGHNSAPIVPDEITSKVQDFSDAAGAWLDLGEIDSIERSQKATDFVAGARKVFKEVDEARKAAKKPHDDAAKAVQDAFLPLLKTVERAADAVKKMQAEFLKRQRDREEAEQREAQAKAQRDREEAERLAAEAAARNDIAGQVAAEEAQKAAAEVEKAASRQVKVGAASATGGGRKMALRTSWRCEVENRGPALAQYRDHPEVIALIERLATAEVRAQQGEKVAPNGFKLIKEETAS